MDQRESLFQSCSPTVMKSDYKITLYKQHELIKPYNMNPFTEWINFVSSMDK